MGTCPSGTQPVYRLFNNRPDANHRYTIDKAVRDQMVRRGGSRKAMGQMRWLCVPHNVAASGSSALRVREARSIHRRNPGRFEAASPPRTVSGIVCASRIKPRWGALRHPYQT
jgi:hypothetical protein